MLERHDLDDALEPESDGDTEPEDELSEAAFSPRDHQAGFWS